MEGDCGGGSVGVSWKYLWVDRGSGGYGWTRVSLCRMADSMIW